MTEAELFRRVLIEGAIGGVDAVADRVSAVEVLERDRWADVVGDGIVRGGRSLPGVCFRFRRNDVAGLGVG